MRRPRMLLASLAALTLVAACSSGSSPAPSTATVAPSVAASAEASVAPPAAELANIWYVNPLPSTPDWGRSTKLFTEAAAALGYKATAVGPDKIDIPTMVSNIEQAIADGADGIITCPLDPAAFKDVIDKAQAAGIVVASIGCVDDNADFSVGTDNTAYGQVAADFIAAANPKAQVGILGTDQTTPNQVKQVEAFKAQVASKYPDMKVLTWEGDTSDAGVAAQKIPAMIQPPIRPWTTCGSLRVPPPAPSPRRSRKPASSPARSASSRSTPRTPRSRPSRTAGSAQPSTSAGSTHRRRPPSASSRPRPARPPAVRADPGRSRQQGPAAVHGLPGQLHGLLEPAGSHQRTSALGGFG